MLTYEFCTLCPRRCGVNRAAGQLGYCRMPANILAARAAVHCWEEPVISGNYGSGAVFFSGCTLGCTFCQNSEISHGCAGREISPSRLREIFLRFIDEGVETINLVTATQFLPSILPALTPKLPVPVVWNSSGYETLETLRALEGYVDVYLPDFKYINHKLAKQLSGAADYPEIAVAAIHEMYRQTGPAVIQEGILQRGVLIRHLILPGCLDNTLGVLDWVASQFSKNEILFSLMRQYMPMGEAARQPPFDRCITDTEYDAALGYLYLLNLENGFTQDADAASPNYIPAFNFEGL